MLPALGFRRLASGAASGAWLPALPALSESLLPARGFRRAASGARKASGARLSARGFPTQSFRRAASCHGGPGEGWELHEVQISDETWQDQLCPTGFRIMTPRVISFRVPPAGQLEVAARHCRLPGPRRARALANLPVASSRQAQIWPSG
jgi:hypothetical protein